VFLWAVPGVNNLQLDYFLSPDPSAVTGSHEPLDYSSITRTVP
jgi:hypothetical protein